VSLLLRAVEEDAPIYVTLTMRSDYQGDCAQFPGLPEALNRSQYLVPRLTSDQRRESIVRPLDLMDVEMTPRLVNRLLNDAGDDPDQLPVLQHALLRMFRHWRDAGGSGAIDLPDYTAIGGIEEALARHGDEILNGLPEDDRPLAEKIFRSLTTTERGRIVRRPKKLADLWAVAGATSPADRKRVETIIAAFAAREHSLLLLSAPKLAPDTVVDITHESLMRKWPRLKQWIREEVRSVEWYADLLRGIERKRAGGAGLWRDPELSEVLARREREGWNEAWAGQCSQPSDPSFAEVGEFLAASREEQARLRHLEEKQRRKDLEQAQALARAYRRTWIILLLLLITIVAGVAAVYIVDWRKERKIQSLTTKYQNTEKEKNDAEKARRDALAGLDSAKKRLREAKKGTVEQRSLQAEVAAMQQRVDEGKAQVDNYAAELDKLRQSEALASSDHGALLKRNQELQDQLDKLRAERDRLLASKPSTAQSPDAALLRSSRELQDQLTLVTGERDDLRTKLREAESRVAAPQTAAPARPTFVIMQEYSVKHLSGAPFAGKVAIGVGNIHHDLPSAVNLYIWTADGKVALPAEVRPGDETHAKRLLDPLDKQPCGPDASGTRFCYRPRNIDTLLGNQKPGTFLLDGVRYEILTTGWSAATMGQADSIMLVIYPAG
jgi:hypothetical protein